MKLSPKRLSSKFSFLLVALTAVLVLRPGSAYADEIPACEYILGSADACKAAYLDSPASSQCEWGSSTWSSTGLTVDLDKLTEHGKRYLEHPNMRIVAQSSCQCDIKFKCKKPTYITFYSGGKRRQHLAGHELVSFQCQSASLESLRRIRFNGNDGLEPGC